MNERKIKGWSSAKMYEMRNICLINSTGVTDTTEY